MISNLHIGDLSTYHSCPRNFYWAKIRRIKPENSYVQAFTDGNYGHEALRAFYEKRELNWTSTDPVSALMVPLVETYKQYYADDAERFDILSCEVSIPFKISRTSLVFTCDVRAIDKVIKKQGILDHKFYKSLKLDDKVELSQQAWNYFWAHKLLGMPFDFFVLNQIKKVDLKQPKLNKDGTISKAVTQYSNYTLDQFSAANPEVEITDEVRANANKTESEIFRRTTVNYNENKAQYFEDRAVGIVKILESGKLTIDEFPMNYGCGHCDWCDFRTLCEYELAGKAAADDLIPFYYQDKQDNER